MTTSDKWNLRYLTLKRLAGEDGPLGAGALRLSLRNQGHTKSESSIGRLLRELQDQGLVQRLDYQGHRITGNGMEHLKEMELVARQNSCAETLLSHLNDPDPCLLEELFQARTAIECEAARLAAIGTDEEALAALMDNVERQKKHLRAGVSIAELNLDFHRLILEASGNRLLVSMYRLLGLDGKWAGYLENARLNVGSSLGVDHFRLIEAIRQKDPEKAAGEMRRHMENTFEDAISFSANSNERQGRS